MRGFCLLGCKVGAKSSTMVSHIPDAIEHGAEIRPQCMAAEILASDEGLATGVRYYQTHDDGSRSEHVQRAKTVVVAGYAIETPRLLLSSTTSRFPNGLANSSGLVGTHLMAQAGPVVWGRFGGMIRQYKSPPACAISEEFYETDPRNDFARGYALQTVAPLPIAMSHLVAEQAPDMFGERLVRAMQDYNHYAAIGVLGEILPHHDNRVTIDPEATDQYGIPVPRIHFSLHDNDRKMMAAGIEMAEQVLDAAGATETHWVERYAHPVGTCRMGATPEDSVVDQWGRSWDVPNLFVCDGSLLPTQVIGQSGVDDLGAGRPHGRLDSPRGAERSVSPPPRRRSRCMSSHDRMRHPRALLRWIASSWLRPADTDARTWQQ